MKNTDHLASALVEAINIFSAEKIARRNIPASERYAYAVGKLLDIAMEMGLEREVKEGLKTPAIRQFYNHEPYDGYHEPTPGYEYPWHMLDDPAGSFITDCAIGDEGRVARSLRSRIILDFGSGYATVKSSPGKVTVERFLK